MADNRTMAPNVTMHPSERLPINYFDMLTYSRFFEDKMTIKKNPNGVSMKALVVTPEPVIAVEEFVSLVDQNHNFNNCPGPNDDTSSDDDNFEDIEYVSLEEENDVDQEEKEFNLEDIFQIQDVILREKLLNVHRLISNIESLKDNPIPIMDSDSSITSLSFSDNSLPEFESFSDHTEETRSGSTTTHANYSLPEFESFHFDPSFPRPPPEPPDVENLEPEINNFYVLNNDEPFDPEEGENVVFLNVEEDDSFTFTIRTFLPFVTYPEVTLLSCSTGSEDTIFDPGIST
ncbi:hypothetical protein Tco_0087000 [Tanacetum coccineum]